MTKDHKEELSKPGNEDYLSYYNQQGKWKPEKAIGAIGAMSAGPGPAIVNLPPTIGDEGHDPRRQKAPAYVIGNKDDRTYFGLGPGPAAYDTRNITNQGPDQCHAPIIGEKVKCRMTLPSPGPAAYHTGECENFAYPRSPAYTMRMKPKNIARAKTPAPNVYTLPKTLGPDGSPNSPYRKGPAFSMAERLDKDSIYQTPNPGPAAYALPPPDKIKRRMPAFSMGTKIDCSKIGTVTPGPASNLYHMVKFHKPSTPRYTFGIRHSPFKAFERFAAES